MDLNTYLNLQGKGAAEALARRIGVPAVLISQWRTGTRQVPAGRCPSIEKATNGAVRCEDLRPDVEWEQLRATKSPKR